MYIYVRICIDVSIYLPTSSLPHSPPSDIRFPQTQDKPLCKQSETHSMHAPRPMTHS